MRSRVLLAVAVCATSLLSTITAASAHDDSEVENGPLEVDVRPAVAKIDHPVHVRARFDTETGEVDLDEDDDAADDDVADDDELEAAGFKTDDDDADDDADEDADDDADDDDADEEAEEPAIAVTFTVDFGDGSEPAAMQLHDNGNHDKRRGGNRGGDDVKAFATHTYGAEGDYEVTVTATPEGGDAVEATAIVSIGAGSARLEGENRIETALRISRDSFDDGAAGAVLLARDDSFADALASATLALAEEAPVLLIPSDGIPEAVLTEIDRVLGGAGRVYLLGGEAAIAPAVADELVALGHDVVRVAGDDRVATSVAIAQFLVDAGATIEEVVLASATSFPDALSGAAYAAEKGAPVLLTAPDALSPAVKDLLVELGTDVAITVVGGTAGVSDAVVDELTALGFTVERLAGDDRYDTAVEIAKAGHVAPTVVIIATGRSFPDALAGGAYAGRNGAPLLLTGDELSDELAQYLTDNADTIKVLIVLGGGGAVPQPVMDDIEAALGL
jgi:putative cell wall-binding protein